MVIYGYGLQLHSLSEEQAEMVRNWRNDAKIVQYMEYREHITPEMQDKWFHKLDALHDFYFLVEYKGEFIGLIHTANIKWATGQGDAGLFIYDDRYLGSHIPVLSSLSMLDILFAIFPLQEVTAKVQAGNEIAARYNQSLGFQLTSGQEGLAFQQYVLQKERYFAITARLRQKATAMSSEGIYLQLSQQEYSLFKLIGLLMDETMVRVFG